jgi:hypothetical protein
MAHLRWMVPRARLPHIHPTSTTPSFAVCAMCVVVSLSFSEFGSVTLSPQLTSPGTLGGDGGREHGGRVVDV